jgi:hypothetical protein
MPPDEPKIFQENQNLEKCTYILRKVKIIQDSSKKYM